MNIFLDCSQGCCIKRYFLSVQILRRYHLQDREDYKKYNKLCGMVTKLTNLLQQLDSTDSDRIQMTDELLDKYAHHPGHVM
jgi:hypothetical protein